MTARFFAIALFLTLNACGSEQKSDSPEAEASTPPPAPKPNFTEREGDKFYYSSALSEDDKNAGKAAGEVVVFRYLGNKDGVYALASNGLTFRCKNPCTIIKGSGPYGAEQNMQYSSDSIIGSAFHDAFNGFMEPAKDDAPAKQ